MYQYSFETPCWKSIHTAGVYHMQIKHSNKNESEHSRSLRKEKTLANITLGKLIVIGKKNYKKLRIIFMNTVFMA